MTKFYIGLLRNNLITNRFVIANNLDEAEEISLNNGIDIYSDYFLTTEKTQEITERQRYILEEEEY